MLLRSLKVLLAGVVVLLSSEVARTNSGKSHVDHMFLQNGVLVGGVTENCQGAVNSWGSRDADQHITTGHQCFNSEQCDGQWVYIDNTGPWCVTSFTILD